jgi:2-polyprenyl-6-methoxyphenol hydroxylase-like FAD-dependent oxidoreductase
MSKNVLISGGGVAGLALACWLDDAGFGVTIVERSAEWRAGGQAIDVRGVALDVVKAMSLLDAIAERRTQLRGMSTVDSEGNEIERTEERTYSAGRLDSPDIEIFRDDLCKLLMEKAGSRIDYLLGDSIRALTQDSDGVSVVFKGGAGRRFDLVIGADGVYSQVRKLVFGGEEAFVKPLGVALALFTTPNLIDLDHWQIAYRDETMGSVIYPSFDHRQLRVSVGFGTDDVHVGRDDVAAQKAVVAEKSAHLGGVFPQLIEAMGNASQFYYGELAQIRMPSWSKGRVVLAGDAAHCASPFSGQGTSLALVGALVLARELARTPEDFAQAFAAYEQRMRPFVDLNQALVDLERRGPAPDDQFNRAKNGIELDDLLNRVA